MKLLIFLLLPLGLWAQCSVNSPSLTATGNTSTVLDNRTKGCNSFALTWAAGSGISALSIQLEGSDDNSTYTAFSGAAVVLVGVNPGVTLSGAMVVQAATHTAYLRVHAVSVTGTGAVAYQLFGAAGVTPTAKLGGSGSGTSWANVTAGTNTKGFLQVGSPTVIEPTPISPGGIYATQVVDGNDLTAIAVGTPGGPAVDKLLVTGSVSANPATVTVAATGADSNVNLLLAAKGTGAVEAPTGTPGDTSTQVATDAFVAAAVAAVTSSFTSITSGTNISAAMICGTGCSLNPGGTGVINANQINGVTVYPVDGTPGFSIAIGPGSLATQTTAGTYENTAVGYAVLAALTTGTNLTGMGFQALNSNTTGVNNTAFGWRSCSNVTTGNWNNCFGHDAGYAIGTSGTDNTFVGEGAGYGNGVASANVNYNTGIGATALLKVQNAGNTAVGYGALASAGNTQYNTALGYNACSTVTTGAHNLCLGYSADVTTNGATERTTIGYNVHNPIDYSVMLGSVGEIVNIPPTTFGALTSSQACSSTTEGSQKPFSDSTTNVIGATITGGGSNHVNGYCNGTNWVVQSGASSGSGGGGQSMWSGLPLTFAVTTTQYAPYGGGGTPSATETAVSTPASGAATIANLHVTIDASLGVAATLTVTLEDGTANPSALTCTTAAAGTSCNDVTHAVNVANLDLLSWKMVSSGTISAGLPNVQISYSVGTSNVGVTSVFGNSGPTVGATGDILSTGNVGGVNGVKLCTGFTPTNGQNLQYTTASSPNPCYTAASSSGGLSPTGTYYLVNSSTYYGPVYQMTPPNAISFTAENMGTATFTAVGNAWRLDGPADSSNSLRIQYIAAPSTPWSITISFLASLNFNSSAGNQSHAGLEIEDSGSGKLITCSYSADTNGGGTPASFETLTWPSSTSGAAARTGGNGYIPQGPVTIKIVDDGTNIKCSRSYDGGQSFTAPWYSASETAYLPTKPNRVGIFVDTTASAVPGMLLLSWLQGTN